MYTLDGLKNSNAIKQYVLKAMQEMKLGSEEQMEYLNQIRKYDFSYLQQVSQEYVEMLNKIKEEQKHSTCKITYVEGLI